MIQFVCNIMAVAALGEARHHAGRMRYAMAALAGRYRFVLVFVAGHTKHILVFGVAAGQHLNLFLVAGHAHLVRSIRSHKDSGRHMGLVAFFALCGNHISGVWFVALGAERNLAVDIVAEAACQGAVLALNLFQFDDLFRVTGEALISDVVGKFDDLRRMRVVVAAQTAGQVVMSLAGMALATGRYDLFYGRRVAGMAILAADAGFVRTAIGGNISRGCRMALHTVVTGQDRPVCPVGSKGKGCNQQG